MGFLSAISNKTFMVTTYLILWIFISSQTITAGSVSLPFSSFNCILFVHLCYAMKFEKIFNCFLSFSTWQVIKKKLLLRSYQANCLYLVLRDLGAQAIGVCNGRIANNLPSEQEAVNLYTSNGIGKMRIYDPNQETLQALRGTNIELILGVPNGDLQSLATASTANDWVQNNIVAFSPAV